MSLKRKEKPGPSFCSIWTLVHCGLQLEASPMLQATRRTFLVLKNVSVNLIMYQSFCKRTSCLVLLQRLNIKLVLLPPMGRFAGKPQARGMAAVEERDGGPD